MNDDFLALRIHRIGEQVAARLERLRLADLTPGELTVRVRYSSINYKDALAATGKGAILRRFPLVGGIDLAGEVIDSRDPSVPVGREVLVCGAGLSETRDGGFSELAKVPVEAAVPLPPGLDMRSAMAIGTAGLTAALAVQRMEQNGQRPDLGPVLVTGATGGVGSVAIDLLATRGYEVVALTGKPDQRDFLLSLGASSVLDRRALELGHKPLESVRWGGAVDSVGGDILAWITRTVAPWGNVASIGLAAGHSLEISVMPFILRGVSLLGINSVALPAALRADVWQRLAGDLKPRHLERIVTDEIALDALPEHFARYIEGRAVGRTVVRIGP